MTHALLTIEKLEVVYHRAITAVQGITLAVDPGRIVALLGTNGAGKSTTLRAISGFLGIDDARVTEGAIASGLVCGPELLLVDELSLGLAPVLVEDLMRRLAEIRRELGIAILIVEQSATVALDIADYGYVMENGRIVLDGTAERLRGHPDMQEFYLGRKSGERRSYRDVKQYRRSRRWYG